MTTYAASAVRALLARGPSEGEDFYRLKAAGNGETHWVNVTPDELSAIADVLDEGEPAHPEHRHNPAPFCAKCGGPCEMPED